jgi:GT2 family glycosyltransferase
VFAQTYRDFEVVLVNDGSPDTQAFEEALDPFRPQITYIVQHNMGPSGARNTAIQVARGEYLAFLDSDDFWQPAYLAVQMQAFRDDPSLILHYVDALLIGNSVLAGRSFMDVVPSVGSVTLEALLTFRCQVNTSCAIVRRGAVLKAGLFDEHLRYSEDFDLWVRLALRGERMGYLRQVLAFHRFHDTSLTATGVGLLHGQLQVYRKLSESAALEPGVRDIVVTQIRRARAALAVEEGKQRLMTRQYEQARTAFDEANSYYQSRKFHWAALGLRLAPRLFRWLYRGWCWLLTTRMRNSRALVVGRFRATRDHKTNHG